MSDKLFTDSDSGVIDNKAQPGAVLTFTVRSGREGDFTALAGELIDFSR